MDSEIKIVHSLKLSKRYKKDADFKELLNTQKFIFTELENGVFQSNRIADNESLFSAASKDSEEVINKLSAVEKKTNKYTIERIKYIKYLKQ